MKKKLTSIIASLSLALGITSTALTRDINYEEQRAEQYKQFYKEYHDPDYKIKISGTRMASSDKGVKLEDVVEIIYGNNLHDNLRDKYTMQFDAYFPKINRNNANYKGPDSAWYYTQFKGFDEEREMKPLESLDKDKMPQVLEDIMALPRSLQEEILCVAHYKIDNDAWIMFYPGTEEKIVRKIYDALKRIDEARDLAKEGVECKMQPVTPTENQLLPFDPFFPNVVFVDENNDGKADYLVELYCIDGSWFNPKAEKRYINLLQWFELKPNYKEGEGYRLYDKPFKITIDFDRGKDYEQEGFDIEFYDENHDGIFESYKIIIPKKS
ncbi:hypothetical protein FJZ53_03595 [Candidatus Woesearchaeota archaeon]|nr:hypothetical protein [Candidatus Woesearchaeota archaeon]